MLDAVQAVITSLRTAFGAAIVTAFTGLTTALEWIPQGIGEWAGVLGMISTAVLLWIQVRRDRREQRRFDVEMKRRKDD